MSDVTLSLLEGRPQFAENVFGWNRGSVRLGMNESRSGILCVNDLSSRRKPKAEEKNPRLLGDLGDIVEIMDPHSQAEGHLRATLLYTKMTAKVVYEALLQKGWSEEELPNRRTISKSRLKRYISTFLFPKIIQFVLSFSGGECGGSLL